MPRWQVLAIARIREFAIARQVRFTLKARRELALLPFAFDEGDACEVLAQLTSRDCAGRIPSTATGEWLYLFKLTLGGTLLYIKVIIRGQCVVVSFHEDGEPHDRA
jgi:hypothetical protein